MLRQSRQHVAIDFYKKRRLREIEKFKTTTPIGWRTTEAPETTNIKVPQATVYGQPIRTGSTVAPITMLSAARKDPFDSLPIPMRQKDFELVDFCELPEIHRNIYLCARLICSRVEGLYQVLAWLAAGRKLPSFD